MRQVVVALGLLLVAGLALGGGAFLTGWRPPSGLPVTEAPVAAAQTAAVPRRVTALGRIVPAEGIRQILAPTADLVGSVKVKAGDEVTADQVLVVLDSRTRREAEIELANQQLIEAQARLNAETAYADASLKEAELLVEQARQEGDHESKIQQARIGLLEKSLQQAELDLKRFTNASPAISAYQRDQQQLLVEKTTAELTVARQVQLKIDGLQEMQEKVAVAKLAAAKANRNRMTAAVPIGSLERQVKLAEQQLPYTEIHAPVAGEILKVLVEPGDVLTPGRPLVELADTAHMEVWAEVYESDIWSVRPDQTVEITSSAFPPDPKTGLPIVLAGKVIQIGQQIARNQVYSLNPAADIDRRVIEVRIALVDQPLNLPPSLLVREQAPAGSAPATVTTQALAARLLQLQVQVAFVP